MIVNFYNAFEAKMFISDNFLAFFFGFPARRTFLSNEKAMDLEEKGIQVSRNIADCVKEADVIFTMVGYPHDVERIYQAEDGIFKHVKKGCILIDMTISSPSLAKKLYEEAKCYDMAMLDAPVSGGDSGAKNATLTIMVGGDKAVYESCKPLLTCLGSSLHYMGEAGCGQHTKACNQIAVAGAVAAMSKAIVYAQQEGIDPACMLNAISKGAAGSWQIDNTAPRVLHKDDAPGFYIKHFIKEEMDQKGIDLQMLNTVCRMYEALAENGKENLGTQALLHFYEHTS